MTSAAPLKATRRQSQSRLTGRSPRIKSDIRIAKNGDILLSMVESAIGRWSLAQKFAMTPSIPISERKKTSIRLPLPMRKGSPERRNIRKATAAATRFRKNTFCMTGNGPARRTKTAISEKPAAASTMKQIPFTVFPLKSQPSTFCFFQDILR